MKTIHETYVCPHGRGKISNQLAWSGLVWSGLNSWLYLWLLICGLVQVLFVSLVGNFHLFNSNFPATALGLDPFSGAYRNKLPFLWCPESEGSVKSS